MINQIIDKLEPDVSKDLKEGLAYSRAYWNNIYNNMMPNIVAQKDLRTYKTKRTIFSLKNFPTNENYILIKSAIREYLPISKALTEYVVLNLEGLSSK